MRGEESGKYRSQVALQLRLWRAVLRAEALLTQAEGEPLET